MNYVTLSITLYSVVFVYSTYKNSCTVISHLSEQDFLLLRLALFFTIYSEPIRFCGCESNISVTLNGMCVLTGVQLHKSFTYRRSAWEILQYWGLNSVYVLQVTDLLECSMAEFDMHLSSLSDWWLTIRCDAYMMSIDISQWPSIVHSCFVYSIVTSWGLLCGSCIFHTGLHAGPYHCLSWPI